MPSGGSINTKTKAHIGFLTVLDHGPQGLFGGYLITNMVGRPIEFHCTAPIKPNRAQEILYGPTLEPYIYGEQIGQTLLGKATVKPMLVCTDRQAAMCVREFVDMPVALIVSAEETAESVSTRPDGLSAPSEDGPLQKAVPEKKLPVKKWRLDHAHVAEHQLEEFHLGHNHLAVPGRLAGEREAITERLADLGESFDLAEPFGRIREAIEEARRGGRQSGGQQSGGR